MANRIIGIGNALVDVLVKVDNESILSELHLPKGSMQLIDEETYRHIGRRLETMDVSLATGGSACNTMLALGNMMADPGVIGMVSDDKYGRFFSDNCVRHHIHANFKWSESPTGVATTFITPDGQRTFATYLGAAAQMTADDVTPEMLTGYDYLYIEGYLVQNHDLIAHAIELARKQGMTVCIDLASYNIVEAERDFFAHLLEQVDIVFANEEEARAFTGLAPREALDALGRLCRVAVVKLGAEGAMTLSDGEFARVPAVPVGKVVDTTAAGDFFAAGFLLRHAEGRSPEACLRTGTALAGAVIRVVGTRLDEATWRQLRREA